MFDKQYLTNLVKGISSEDVPNLHSVIGRLKSVHSIILEADFNHYGSGTCSYVPVYISKRDKSDVKVTKEGNLTTYDTSGLIVYLCRHAPYAVFGKGEWSSTYEGKNKRNGYIPYIGVIGSLPSQDWGQRIIEISNILNIYGIGILSQIELDVKLDFDIKIPTVFTRPASYTVFDCFFYWED